MSSFPFVLYSPFRFFCCWFLANFWLSFDTYFLPSYPKNSHNPPGAQSSATFSLLLALTSLDPVPCPSTVVYMWPTWVLAAMGRKSGAGAGLPPYSASRSSVIPRRGKSSRLANGLLRSCFLRFLLLASYYPSILNPNLLVSTTSDLGQA